MARAEAQIGGRILRQVHPAHRVDAELLGRLLEPDGRAVRLVHRLALFVHHEPMSEEGFERRDCRPSSSPSRASNRTSCGTGRGSTRGRGRPDTTSANSSRLVLYCERRERNDARVEPGIADVGHARHQVAGLRVLDLHAVDPRAVRRVPLELVPTFDGPLFQFGQRADRPSNSPVFSSTQIGSASPQNRFLEISQSRMLVSHSSSRSWPSMLGGSQRILPRDVFDLLPPVHVDEPLVDEAEDQLVPGAPAKRIDVRIFFDVDEQMLLLERVEDELGRFRIVGLAARQTGRSRRRIAPPRRAERDRPDRAACRARSRRRRSRGRCGRCPFPRRRPRSDCPASRGRRRSRGAN